jgi:hypothetical protein
MPIDLRPLTGRWVNHDKLSTGISRIEIGTWEGLPIVRVTGAGRPDPIDWGEVAGIAFVDGYNGMQTVAFTANYSLAFAQVLLTGHLDKDRLLVDTYSIFTDASGRASYFHRDSFYLP